MLLIYPPVARSTEPPPGIARLAGSLGAVGLPVRCLDLNQEGFDWLLGFAPPEDISMSAGVLADDTPANDTPTDRALTDRTPARNFKHMDTWTRGAFLRRERNLALLRDPAGYPNFDRYKRAVLDLNRTLRVSARALFGVSGQTGSATGYPLVTLADYQDPHLSPLRSADLLRSAEDHATNLYFQLFSTRIDKALETFPAGTIGISLVFLSQALVAFAIAGWIRARHPGLRIVMGGGLVTSWMRQGSIISSGPDSRDTAFNGLIDAFLPGPGEESLPAWLGIARENLPAACPDFRDFNLDAYFSPGRTLSYSFSTGCPWKRCTFCPEKAEDSPFRGIPPAIAVDHLRALAVRYKPSLFHFTDNEIAPAWLRALAADPPGVPWYGFARFSRELADPVFCRDLARSGCVLLQLGLESGRQSVLDALGKGTDMEEIDAILVNLKEAGIATYIYVLFGTPAETRESALVTRDFLESRSDRIGFINAAIFNMPVSGEEVALHGTFSFYEGDLSLYCAFEHPDGWNRDAVRAFLKRDFGAFPGIGAILARTPPLFTSSHAAFFI